MSIDANIGRIMADILDDPTDALEQRISWEATQAILAGINSEEWKTYMRNFIDAGDEAQLRRLTLQDSAAEDPVIRRTLVYLAAMGVCTGDTFSTLRNFVDPAVLDLTLASSSSQPVPETSGAKSA